MRLIIYTGQKNVGKTSIALASSIKLAEQGMNTLVVSMDENNSLSKLLGESIGSTPKKIQDNLWTIRLSKTENHWQQVHKWLLKNMKWEDLKDISIQEIPVIPGMAEVIQLLGLNKIVMSNQYDVIILDYKPMNEVLRILSYPELFKWWLEKQLGKDRHLLKFARPFARIVSGDFDLPDDNIMKSIEYLLKQLVHLQNIILNKKITSFKMVVNPEKMNVFEAMKDYTYLNKLGFLLNAIIINKIYPCELNEGYLTKWYNTQLGYVKEIENNFQQTPIFQVLLLEEELDFLMLKKLAKNLEFE